MTITISKTTATCFAVASFIDWDNWHGSRRSILFHFLECFLTHKSLFVSLPDNISGFIKFILVDNHVSTIKATTTWSAILVSSKAFAVVFLTGWLLASTFYLGLLWSADYLITVEIKRFCGERLLGEGWMSVFAVEVICCYFSFSPVDWFFFDFFTLIFLFTFLIICFLLSFLVGLELLSFPLDLIYNVAPLVPLVKQVYFLSSFLLEISKLFYLAF